MNLPQCWLCDIPINDSIRHKEHILPESLGGRRTVTDFICKKCNNDTGSKWDKPLLESVRPLASIACVGSPGKGQPSLWRMADGRMINQYPDGRWEMAPERPIRLASRLHDHQVEVIGQPGHSTFKDDVRNFKKYLQRFSDTDLGFNIEKALDSLEIRFTETKMEFDVCREFQFGDPQSVKSLLKSILALAFEAGVNRTDCNSILSYLKGETLEFPYVLYGVYGGEDVIRNREDAPYLCVHVSGQPICGELISYAELCGYRIVAVLSRDYRGHTFTSTYAVDIVSKEEQFLECEVDEYMVSVAEWLMPVYGIADHAEFNRILGEQLNTEIGKWLKRSTVRAYSAMGKSAGDRLSSLESYEVASYFIAECKAVFSRLSETGLIDNEGLESLSSDFRALLTQAGNVLGTNV